MYTCTKNTKKDNEKDNEGDPTHKQTYNSVACLSHHFPGDYTCGVSVVGAATNTSMEFLHDLFWRFKLNNWSSFKRCFIFQQWSNFCCCCCVYLCCGCLCGCGVWFYLAFCWKPATGLWYARGSLHNRIRFFWVIFHHGYGYTTPLDTVGMLSSTIMNPWYWPWFTVIYQYWQSTILVHNTNYWPILANMSGWYVLTNIVHEYPLINYYEPWQAMTIGTRS